MGICLIDGILYVIGGEDANQDPVLEMDSYDLQRGIATSLASCHFGVSRMSVCSYEKNFIFKFGGKMKGGELCQVIELYDISKNVWSVLNPKIRFF